MLTQAQATERSKAGVRRWYGENRDEYNALRRERYASNKDARKKAQLRAAKRRKEERNGGVSILRRWTRELNDKRVEVLSTGQVADMMKRTPQMLRNWEREELIPKSVFPDTHRLYTRQQARMIVTLGRVIKRNGGSWDNTETRNYIQKIWWRW